MSLKVSRTCKKDYKIILISKESSNKVLFAFISVILKFYQSDQSKKIRGNKRLYTKGPQFSGSHYTFGPLIIKL